MEFFHEFTGNNTGHDDLMGITHHTGDKWLDKKLNESTANIGFLASMALGTVASKLAGGSRQPQAYGGGFDPEIKPYMRQGLQDLQQAYQDPGYFQGPRVAAFDPAQLQAQTSLLALSSADPDYFRRAETGLEEAIGLQRQAAAPITAEAIQAQREVLAPVAEAERMAARRQLQEGLRDIGVGAGGAGVGALEGGRADVLRGVSLGEFAQTEAGIQSRLTQQAIQQERAQREAQAAGAASLASLYGEQLGIGRGATSEAISRAGLAADVGAQRRALAQDFIGAEREMFEEQDPFARAQRYLATVQSAPTQKTQYYQPRSTLQEAAGLASIFSGMGGFAAGGGIAQAAGMSEAEFDALDADIEAADRINAAEDAANLMERGGVRSALAELAKGDEPLREERDDEYDRKKAAAQAKLQQTVFRARGDVIAAGNPASASPLATMASKKDIEEAKKNIRRALASGQIDQKEYDRQIGFLVPKKPKQTDKNQGPTISDKASSLGRSLLGSIGGAKTNPFEGMTDAQVMDVQMRAVTPAEQDAAQKELQSRQAARPTGAQVRAAAPSLNKRTVAAPTQAASLSTPATTTIAPAPPQVSSAGLGAILDDRGQPVTIAGQDGRKDSIMNRILGGVRSGLESISSKNLDPFKDYTPQERIRIGLGILGAVPEIGEGAFGPIGRGALLAIEDLPEFEEITPRVAPVPSSEYAVIDEGILKLQKTKTKMGAERRNQLRRESEQEVIQAIRSGQVANDPASYRTAVLANYERKVRDEAGVRSPDADSNQTVVAPQGKGSASSGIAVAGQKTS